MRDAAPNLTRFLRRLHRRLVFVRLMEHAGLGAACAAAVVVLLMPVLMLRDKPALPVLLALLPLGTCVGAAWALLRRPRLIHTAGEADRQLQLADLFATAWTIARDGRAPDDPFELAVLAGAEARAATAAPSSVVLNRLGARAWTGVGLTAALAVTLTLLSANPIDSHAGVKRRVAQQLASPAAKDSGTGPIDAVAASRSMPIVADHPDREEDAFNPARRTTAVAGEAGDSNHPAEAADPTGSGGGAGTSRSDPQARRPDPGSAAARDGRDGSLPGGGGGGGRPSAPGDAGGGTSSLSTGETGVGRASPPWSTTAWNAHRTEAIHAVRAGAVPQRYHDVIRSYFERKAGQP